MLLNISCDGQLSKNTQSQQIRRDDRIQMLGLNITVWHLYIPVAVLFGAWTVDRFVHLLWAGTFFAVFLIVAVGYKSVVKNKSLLVRYWTVVTHPKNHSHLHGLALALFVLFLGSWIPDIDWKFNVHRSPITHSILPYLAMALIIKNWQFGDTYWSQMLVPVFGIALGSHLLIDIVQGGNLVGVPVEYELSFYIVNGLLLCGLSYFQMRRALQKNEA